ncbi:MAG: hypothetical protein KatS3mg105_0088 [Gemmatales bacterium]|nr:MAG: hypothetical protein KatS3mg105_0088 [Gemmatales bacterium]
MLDPMCGAGTILAEARQAQPKVRLMGGDLDRRALRAASLNLRRMTPFLLARWDATRLPLPDSCVDAIVSNPPFGKQLGEPDDIKMLYHRMVIEYNRVLKPEGRVVLLVADRGALMSAVKKLPWHLQREFSPRILGQIASLLVLAKTFALLTESFVAGHRGACLRPGVYHFAITENAMRLPIVWSLAVWLVAFSAPIVADTIEITTPMPAPVWATMQRELLRANAEACREFFRNYFDDRGYLLCVERWGGDDGPDDAIECCNDWPILHALGGDDSVLHMYKKSVGGASSPIHSSQNQQSPLRT